MGYLTTQPIDRPVEELIAEGRVEPARNGTLLSAPVALLDLLFAPHGPSAYFGHLRRNGGRGGIDTVPDAAPAPAERTPADEDGVGTDVELRASGISVASAGTLLETAESAGLEPRNRCRRGICGTCTTQKLEGAVVDLRTGEVHEGAGSIRICVSEARGPVCLDL